MLEIAWCWTSALDSFPPEVHSALIRTPDELPKKVQEITGISAEDLLEAEEPAKVWEEFHRSATSRAGLAVAHYAQFERGFLKQFYEQQGAKVPFEDFCSYRIAKRLFPEAPSSNIRGLAGYLGFEFREIRRAADHVLATAVIWQRVASELHRIGVKSESELRAWLKAKAPGKSVNTNFRVDRLKRLQLPKVPGIYRMLAKNGEILYVGKATSLHSRVNSYFRGGCVGDRRKLEMLARVWDVEVEECGSPLEAALRENEEIKRLSPHYNRALKSSPRPMIFFARDFSTLSLAQSAATPLGPFREKSAVHQVAELVRGLAEGPIGPVFFDYVPEEVMREGFRIFRETHELPECPGVRSLLALGLWLSRLPEELAEEDEPEEEVEPEGQLEVLDTAEVAERFGSLFRQAGRELRRTKRLGRLVNSRVSWSNASGEERRLQFLGGKISLGEEGLVNLSFPWQGLNSDDYDRLSVLQAELNKIKHQVEPLFVAERFDGVEERGLAGGVDPEHDPDRRGKGKRQRHRARRNGSGPARHQPEHHRDQPAERNAG